MRRAARTDANQRDLVQLFEAHGCHVHICSSYGGGHPDLMCGFGDRIALVEVKRGKGTLTPDQVEFHRVWPVFTVRDDQTAREVITWLKAPAATS